MLPGGPKPRVPTQPWLDGCAGGTGERVAFPVGRRAVARRKGFIGADGRLLLMMAGFGVGALGRRLFQWKSESTEKEEKNVEKSQI